MTQPKSNNGIGIVDDCRKAYEDLHGISLTLIGETTRHEERILSSPEFLRIPWHYILALRKARVPLIGVLVYLILWRRSCMRKQWTVSLSSDLLAPFGLRRWDKARAIACLERAGFIAVVCQRGKNPLVTLKVETAWREPDLSVS